MMEHDIPLGMRFSIIDRSFKHQLDALLREKELTGVQFCVLGRLGRLEREGCADITQRDLEKLSHVTHPTMTEILKRLEKKGFILCRVGESDRRCKLISTTDKGIALLDEMKSTEERVFATLTAGMSAEDICELTRLTDIMLENSCAKGRDNE